MKTFSRAVLILMYPLIPVFWLHGFMKNGCCGCKTFWDLHDNWKALWRGETL